MHVLPVEWWCVCRWIYSRNIAALAMFCLRIPLRAAPPWTSRSSLRPTPPCWHNNRTSGPNLYPITVAIQPHAWNRCAVKKKKITLIRVTDQAPAWIPFLKPALLSINLCDQSNGVSLCYVTGQRSCDLQSECCGLMSVSFQTISSYFCRGRLMAQFSTSWLFHCVILISCHKVF